MEFHKFANEMLGDKAIKKFERFKKTSWIPQAWPCHFPLHHKNSEWNVARKVSGICHHFSQFLKRWLKAWKPSQDHQNVTNMPEC